MLGDRVLINVDPATVDAGYRAGGAEQPDHFRQRQKFPPLWDTTYLSSTSIHESRITGISSIE